MVVRLLGREVIGQKDQHDVMSYTKTGQAPFVTNTLTSKISHVCQEIRDIKERRTPNPIQLNEPILVQFWMRGGQIRTILRSQTVTVLPRRAVMVRMVGVILAPFTIDYVSMNPTIPTSHHIMLQFLLPQIHCLLKAL